MDKLLIPRQRGFMLTVRYADGRFSLSANGGQNLTPSEVDAISDFAQGREGSDDFLAKIQSRAAR